MAEIVQSVISEVARDTLKERGERAAMQPDFELPEDEAAGRADPRRPGRPHLHHVL